MAKKRKSYKKIEKVEDSVDVEESPPKCFGCKEEYCRPELCGKWFEKCVTSNPV
jgi:hypothetical protein